MTKCRKVFSNLLQQNVYLRDCCSDIRSKSVQPITEYLSIDEVSTDTGIELRETVNPYPHTPEVVSSYALGCDYKSDPVASVLNSPKRQNLGDVSALQDFNNLSDVDKRSLYASLKAKFEPQSSVDSSVLKSALNNSEVNDDVK